MCWSLQCVSVQMQGLVDSIMQQLLSKEVLYQPVKVRM